MWRFLQLVLSIALTNTCVISAARACETVEYRPTPAQLENDALGFWRQSTTAYEGLLIGGHNFERGGHLLVVKAYKGPAQPLTIIKLPGGSSCYEGISPFSAGIWAYTSAAPGFDGFATNDYVRVWKQHRLIHNGLMEPLRALYLGGALLAACLVLTGVYLVRRMRRKTDPH